MAGAKLESSQSAVSKSQEAPRRERAAAEPQKNTQNTQLTESSSAEPAAAEPVRPPPWRTPSPGQPLPADVQALLRPALGEQAPLAARVHTGQYAQLVAGAFSARAVTAGADIFFAQGEYRPGTASGNLLIAHEVAHVQQAQQGLLRRAAPKRKGGGDRGGEVEAQADQKARAATGATPAPARTTAGSPERGQSPAGDRGKAQAPTQDKGGAEPGGGAGARADKAEAPAAAPAAAGAGPAPAGAAAGPTADGLLMPEPPRSLSAQEQARLQKAQGQAEAATTTQTTVPQPEAEVATAREAVAEPAEEAKGKAAGDVVAAVDDRPAPSPEIEQLCKTIQDDIKAMRPPDESSLVKAKPDEMAKAAGRKQDQAIRGDVDKVSGSYDDVKKDPGGQPAPAPGPMAETPAAVPATDLKAQQGAPDAVPPKAVSLDGDVKASQQQMEDAGLNTEPAKLVEDGPIAQAREAQGELSEMAQREPEKVLAEQQTALGQARADMASLQKQATQALATARKGHVGSAKGQKSGMKLSEEEQRRQAGKDAEALFTTTQDQVKKLLEPLPETAMKQWDAGVALLSTNFKQRLSRVEGWIKERHSGGWGTVVAVWDDWTGLPEWVTDEYNAAEKDFGDGVCTLIKEISTVVNGVIKTCEGLIEKARKDITDLYAKLPASLQEWAKGEQARFGKQLDQLKEQAHKTRDDFNKDLIDRATQAVQDARQQIHELREAAKGVLGRLKDAIGEFLKDPVKALINGLLKLVGISPSAFWSIVARVQQVAKDIADDPLGFVNNLVSGVGKGFSLFIDNFGKHLLAGFLDWLFSALRKDGVGIEVPTELSAKSVIKFVLQLLGISWARVRKLLVEQLGEKTVSVLEKAAGLIATLVTEGIEGVVKLIKERLDPKMIIDAMIDAGIRYLVDTVATKVAAKILSMLNPAGAILQAITLIYDVLKWVFTNASRIFSFVEAVVNGMADVVAGNIEGLAKSVERALAMLVPIVIALFAQILGLDGLPKKVAESVKGIHGAVEAALRTAVKWLVDQAKKLLAKLGIGGKEKDKDKKDSGEVGEKVPFGSGKQRHTLWVKVQGAAATLMVSSTPMTVLDWLSDMEKKVAELPDKGSARSDARKLLDVAITQLAETDKAADKAAADKAADASSSSASGGGPPTGAAGANEETKKDEHKLADTLAKLAEIFGEELVGQVPSELIAKKVKVPKPDMDEQLRKDVVKSSSGMLIHSGTPAEPPLLVKVMVEKFGAKFDKKTKKLSLKQVDGTSLASQRSLSLLGAQIGTDTGVPRVKFRKVDDSFHIEAEAGPSVDVAYGDVPGVLGSDDVVKIANERFDELLPSWIENVVGSGIKEKVGTKEVEIWSGFKFNSQNLMQGAIEILKRAVKEKKIDTLQGLRDAMREPDLRVRFHTEAGNKAAIQAARYGVSRATDSKLKDKIKTKVQFTYNEHKGRIETPLSEGDHDLFYPLDITSRVEGEKIITTYRTKAGQSFEVVQEVKTGSVVRVEGKNLSLKGPGDPQGRGKTESPADFKENMDLNRSHLIADEFKGSGYAEALNLISASDHYNKKVMRNAERAIGAFLINNKATTFTLVVTVTWGEVIDEATLRAILAAPWYPKEYQTEANLKAAIQARLATTPNLRRCAGVVYDVEITAATEPGHEKIFTTDIGPDIWLLLKKK